MRSSLQPPELPAGPPPVAAQVPPPSSHPTATCCWCGSPLVLLAASWWCPREPCALRQLRYSTYTQDPAGRVGQYLYVPTPKQSVWHEAVYTTGLRRMLCGGAAGPGKSRMIREALYLLARQVPGLHALLLRRTYKDLEQSHLRFMPHELHERGAEYKATERLAVFAHQDGPPALIRCGHLETEADIENYLSAEYDVIAPDELVTFPRDQMLELFTRCRSTNPAFIALRGNQVEDYDGAFVLAATNPGARRRGAWVKEFFIDRAPDRDEFPDYEPAHWGFFPAYLKDNPYIRTGGYTQALSSLREGRRRQLLEGDWSVFEGQFFDEFRPDRHVVDPGVIGPDAHRFLSLDWGRNSPGVALWWAALPDGHYHIEDEYKFNGDVIEGKSTVKDVCIEINRRCRALELARTPACWTDPACWTNGPDSIAEMFLRGHVPVVKANNDRVNGWQRLHEMLRLAPDGRPWLTLSPRCVYGIRTIPAQLQSSSNPDDLDTDGDDHWVDAARYGCVSGVRWGATQHQTPPPYGSAAWWREVNRPPNPGLLGSESRGN